MTQNSNYSIKFKEFDDDYVETNIHSTGKFKVEKNHMTIVWLSNVYLDEVADAKVFFVLYNAILNKLAKDNKIERDLSHYYYLAFIEKEEKLAMLIKPQYITDSTAKLGLALMGSLKFTFRDFHRIAVPGEQMLRAPPQMFKKEVEEPYKQEVIKKVETQDSKPCDDEDEIDNEAEVDDEEGSLSSESDDLNCDNDDRKRHLSEDEYEVQESVKTLNSSTYNGFKRMKIIDNTLITTLFVIIDDLINNTLGANVSPEIDYISQQLSDWRKHMKIFNGTQITTNKLLDYQQMVKANPQKQELLEMLFCASQMYMSQNNIVV